MRNQIFLCSPAVMLLLLINRFFKVASGFTTLIAGNQQSLSYSIKSGEVVLSQFQGHDDLQDKVVLDHGCGFGGKTVFFSTKGAKVVYGVDFHDDYSLAEDLAKKNNLRVEFRKMAVDNHIPVDDESIDTVISSTVFEHVEHVDLAINEIQRVLKPGGVALIRWHPFLTRYGSHVRGLIGIPFVHYLFSERTIVQAYSYLSKKQNIDLNTKTSLMSANKQESYLFTGIGLFFNKIGINKLKEDFLKSGFHLLLVTYYHDKKERKWVIRLPNFLKYFFMDYEVVVFKKGSST